MTFDLIGLMGQMFQSGWFYVLTLLAAASFYWYYIKHASGVVLDESARQPKALFKNFVLGQPLILVVVLVVVIAIVAAATYILDIQLA